MGLLLHKKVNWRVRIFIWFNALFHSINTQTGFLRFCVKKFAKSRDYNLHSLHSNIEDAVLKGGLEVVFVKIEGAFDCPPFKKFCDVSRKHTTYLYESSKEIE